MGAGVANSYRYGKAADPIAAPLSECQRAADAAFGSDTLRNRIHAMFDRFEREHRLQPGEGRVLLLDTGVRL